MRLASFVHDNRESYGMVLGESIADLGHVLGERYPDLRNLLAGLPADLEATARAAPRHDISSLRFLPVIPRPEKIICVGLNYREHVGETGRATPTHPVLFLRLPQSQVGHLEPIVRPRVSQQLDYEGELAVVIGKRGRHISPSRAFDHVAGYSIYNEASVRDWQKHTHQYTAGKNFVGTGAFGPWLLTADRVPDPRTLRLTTRLNGITMQEASIAELIFPIEALIAYISTITELTPGDVLVTGTPSGVGGTRTPPIWMQPGDEVEVEISQIGVLRNPVAQESAEDGQR